MSFSQMESPDSLPATTSTADSSFFNSETVSVSLFEIMSKPSKFSMSLIFKSSSFEVTSCDPDSSFLSLDASSKSVTMSFTISSTTFVDTTVMSPTTCPSASSFINPSSSTVSLSSTISDELWLSSPLVDSESSIPEILSPTFFSSSFDGVVT